MFFLEEGVVVVAVWKDKRYDCRGQLLCGDLEVEEVDLGRGD